MSTFGIIAIIFGAWLLVGGATAVLAGKFIHFGMEGIPTPTIGDENGLRNYTDREAA